MKCITNVDSGIEHKEELWLGEIERIYYILNRSNIATRPKSIKNGGPYTNELHV